MHGIPGFSTDDTNVVNIGDAGTIKPERCPPVHRSADHLPKGAGTLPFVTGDLVNPQVCAGPFDVVIERRTVQLFPPEERLPAVQRLVARLENRGVFVSQQHAGGWRPDEPRTHLRGGWLKSAGVRCGPAQTASSPILLRASLSCVLDRVMQPVDSASVDPETVPA